MTINMLPIIDTVVILIQVPVQRAEDNLEVKSKRDFVS